MTTIRVLIVDADPVTRGGMRAALDLANDVVVVGEAASVETAIEHAVELAPDVVFMDVRVPGIGGIKAATAIRQASPGTRVILLTDDASHASVSEAIRAGVSGYLLTDADAEELVNAARAVLEGRTHLHAALTAALTEEARIEGRPIDPLLLSRREQEILRRLAYGTSGKQIGKELGISPNTVRQSVQRILEKLGARSRLEAIARFRASGSETIREREPKTRTEWIHRLSEPHLRRIMMERREDQLRRRGKTPSAAARAEGRRFLDRVYDELGESDLRNAVQDLTQEMSDEEFARLVELTRKPPSS